jgi:hypothetical protein
VSAWQDFKRGFLRVIKYNVGPSNYEDLGESVGVWFLVILTFGGMFLAISGVVLLLTWALS